MLVYDIEIANPIRTEKTKIDPKYTYANGWNDFEGMGIAVIGWYNFNTDEYGHHLGDKDSLLAFQDMITSIEKFVGFNTIGFDNKLLRAHGINVFDEKSYDILQQIWFAVGLDANKYEPRTHGGFSLGKVSHHNLGRGKTGDGADAPYMWQDGKKDEVIDYCVNGDVKLTKDLLSVIYNTGQLISPKSKRVLQIALP